MLTEANLKELAKRAGLNAQELIKAVKSETEETIDFDAEGEFLSHYDLESLKERAVKEGYKEGKKAGEEMFIKDIKNEEGLEFEGKSRDTFLRTLKEKIQRETGSEPNKRIEELMRDNEKLRANYTEKENELKAEAEKFNKRLHAIEIENVIKGALPEKLTNGLTREQAYKLYKADREFTKTDTGIVLVDPSTKEVVKDKKLNPVSVTDNIQEFINSFGTFDSTGRGGGDNIPTKKTNIESMTKRSQVYDYIEKNDIPISEQAGILAKAMKNEGFDMNA